MCSCVGCIPAEDEFGHAKKLKKSKPAASISPSPPGAPTRATASPAEVDAAIGTSLYALKERLFRLELRHQGGTISDEEYTQERALAERVLRDLVPG